MTDIFVRTTGNDSTGTGLTGAPYATLNKALSVAAGGDVIHMGTGTYAETSGSGFLNVNQVFSSQVAVVPESGVRGSVVITGGSSTTLAVIISGGSNVWFDAITFQAQASTVSPVLRFTNDPSNILLTRCTLVGWSVSALAQSCVSTTSLVNGAQNIQFVDCDFEQIGQYPMYGIAWGETSNILSPSQNVEIRSCRFRTGGPGWRLLGVVNARMFDNDVRAWSPLSTSHGASLGQDAATGQACSGALVGNRIYTYTGHAFVVGAGCDGVFVGRNEFHGGIAAGTGQGLVVKEAHNVLIKKNTITSGTLSGLYMKAAVDIQAIDNEIYVEHPGAGGIQVLTNVTDSLPCQRITFRRNTVYATAGQAIIWGTAGDDSGGSHCDENVYIVTGTATLGTVRGTTVSTLSQLKAAWGAYSRPQNDANSQLGRTHAVYAGVPANPISATGGTVNSVIVTNPGAQTNSAYSTVNLAITARSFAGKTLTYSASGLPAGLSINSATGAISGQPTTVSQGWVQLTVTDSDSNTATTSFKWSVSVERGFADDFNRADGALGSTPHGKAWDTTYAGWVVSSNKAGNPSAASTVHTSVDAGITDGTLTVTMRGTFNVNAALNLRYSTSNNRVMLDWNGGSNNPRLRSVVGGSVITTLTGTGGAWADGDVITVQIAGNVYTVKKNGATIVSGTIAEDATNTRFGFSLGSTSTAVFFDDVSFA